MGGKQRKIESRGDENCTERGMVRVDVDIEETMRICVEQEGNHAIVVRVDATGESFDLSRRVERAGGRGG